MEFCVYWALNVRWLGFTRGLKKGPACFVIKSAHHDGMACGSSGNQYKNAPIAGKMMAELISCCESGHDHDEQPLQFELPYTGYTIDVGFYSRKRPINQESSFSVLG